MPELPEIESLRRSLRATIRGAAVVRGGVIRRDMLHRVARAPANPLVSGDVILELHRLGKQLVIEMRSGACLLLHLGMSGSIRVVAGDLVPESHVHAAWQLRQGDLMLWLRHRDPRRFGWLESHACMDSVRTHAWSMLGPDALEVSQERLWSAMRGRGRPLKSLLLDQRRIAGLGNIYVDEILFRARLHPQCRSNRVTVDAVTRLAEATREVLARAVELGGSTIRDHRTAEGSWGAFQHEHHVYGRSGKPCRVCQSPLTSRRVAQRTTVFCGTCQRRRP